MPSAVSVGDWLPPLAGTLAKSSDLSTIEASDKARARKATAEAPFDRSAVLITWRFVDGEAAAAFAPCCGRVLCTAGVHHHGACQRARDIIATTPAMLAALCLSLALPVPQPDLAASAVAISNVTDRWFDPVVKSCPR